MAVALINAAAHPAAIPYFTRYPQEPIPGQSFVTIDKMVDLVDSAVVKGKRVRSPMTNLTTLLKAILVNAKSGGDVVIVMHGNDAGLFVKISTGVGFNVAAMSALVMAMEGRYGDDEASKVLKLQLQDWKNLKDQLTKVQKLALNRVDLRACKVGKDADTMYFLTKVFGCAVCCAPDLYDFYGAMDLKPPSKDPKDWEKWSASHPGANLQSFPSGRFAYQYTIVNTSLKVEAWTDSEDAPAEWVARNLPKGNYTSGTIYIHGLTDEKSPLIFAGDPRYRDHLKEAKKGAERPKINVNAPIEP